MRRDSTGSVGHARCVAGAGKLRWLMALALAAVIALALPGRAQAGIDLDSIEQLKLLGRGVQPPLAIDGARFRVAVFAFDDPDRLELGEALAALARHEVLLGARVSSLGVLRFSNPMAPGAAAGLEAAGYFERIDALATAQQATLSLWGTVRRVDERIVIDTYLQVPPATLELGLVVRLPLPAAMGGGRLVGRVGGDRLLLQSTSLALADAEAVRAAAARLGELRERPDAALPVVRRLPGDTVYAVLEQRPPWVRLRSKDGAGWGRTAAFHCTGPCVRLLDSARFASALLAFIDRRQALQAGDGLSRDAAVFAAQTQALVRLQARGQQPGQGPQQAVQILRPWATAPAEGAPLPGLGGSANLLLLARVSAALVEAGMREGGPYDRWRAPQAEVLAMAFEAADTLQHDPQNLELLRNLERLFVYGDEPRRARLARRLLDEAASTSRLPALSR